MPLHNVFEGMVFRLLKGVCPVQGVEPGVEKILCPVIWSRGREGSIAEEEGGVSEVVHVL